MAKPTLTREARRFVQALDDLGFNGDDSVSGADTVDVIGNYLELLNKLPALAEVAEQVEKLIKAKGRFHTEQNYAALVTAFDKLEAK